MIDRELLPALLARAKTFSVVTLTGPRQSGKTTLCKMAFPDRRRVSLEPLDMRDFARTDPRGFLASLPDGGVLDEVQRCPDLLSYLQEDVDDRPHPGRWILTGSNNLQLQSRVSQTLAGRTALLTLLPCGLEEADLLGGKAGTWAEAALRGGYPAPMDRGLDRAAWLASYVATYVERDVRDVLQIGDLLTFQAFLRLCAGRAGQLLNLSQVASDVGVAHNTIRSWVSVLETTYIAFRLAPWHASLTKREVKTPKLYFWDTGLLCWLLGIRDADQLGVHPLRGAVFENLVAAELHKANLHRGQVPNWFFYRDHLGTEVDFVEPTPSGLRVAKAESAATMTQEFLAPIERLRALTAKALPMTDAAVIFGGDTDQRRTGCRVVTWRGTASWAMSDTAS